MLILYVNCVPKLVWDFPRLCGHDTLIKFYLSNKATRTVIHSLKIKVKSYLNEGNIKKFRFEKII